MEMLNDISTPTRGSNETAGSKFELELIDRFFDHNSYYLHGFMSYLQEQQDKLENPLDVVTVGLLVDEIINASNKLQKLRQLERFERFNFYRQQLAEGIAYLENHRLTTQQMMEVVGSLGKSFAETLGDLVSHDEYRAELLAMVGLRPDEKVDLPEQISESIPASSQRAATSKEDMHSNPWVFFKRDMRKEIQVLQKLIRALEKTPEDQRIFTRIKNVYKNLRDWSMIYGDQGIEAISHKILLLYETVYTKAPDEFFQVIPILKEAGETIRRVNEAGPGSEHLDIVGVMVHQIEKERIAYPGKLGMRKAVKRETGFHPETGLPWSDKKSGGQEPSYQADQPAEPEEFESEIVPEAPENKSIEEQFPTVQEISQGMVEEGALPATEIVHKDTTIDLDDPVAVQFSDLIREIEEDVSASDQADKLQSSENEAKMHEENSLDSFDSIRESELLSELVNEHVGELDKLDIPELEELNVEPGAPENQSESDSLTLPGEDDKELQALLSEFQGEEGDETGPGNEPESSQESVSQSKEKASPSEVPEEPIAFSGKGADFILEADMYFSFARKALQQLMKNSFDRQALEDIELACYSLKAIGERLGYIPISRLMGTAEKLVQSCIERQQGLKTEPLNALFAIINEVEKSGRKKTLNTAERKKWCQRQEKALSRWIEIQEREPHKDSSNASTPLEGEKTEAKGQSEDPLDFLLFDDTSKDFKQLLND